MKGAALNGFGLGKILNTSAAPLFQAAWDNEQLFRVTIDRIKDLSYIVMNLLCHDF